jgi:hypothetical protein
MARVLLLAALLCAAFLFFFLPHGPKTRRATATRAAAFDTSVPLASIHPGSVGADPVPCAGCLAPDDEEEEEQQQQLAAPPDMSTPEGSGAVEQRAPGTRDPAKLILSFDGLGVGFEGPQGPATGRNPSDNSLAAGPNHIVQTVNSRLAIFDKTGKVLYGAVPTNTVFKGFGGICEQRLSGDAVVRYDQLADRWLLVLPIFSRIADRPQEPYSVCYAVSQTPDPLGAWHRYEFRRKLFPDYPRPAIWPDGYYIPTSTGDEVIQKHICIADRTRMLKGEAATEQCVIIDGVNFLNNADIDGHGLPPAGAPNIMMAAGGTQLKKVFEDDGIYAWKVHVDWEDPSKTTVSEAAKVKVAAYHYLCNGQLTNCVPQPGTTRRLDAQGDKIMQRLIYRNIGGHEVILAQHSINTTAGGGGVRWYEFRLDEQRNPVLHQQSTYAPDGRYRWMGSMAMDRKGNIGVGYSFGGPEQLPGQRFAGRLAGDPPNALTFRESILVEGEASQANAMRWEDYTTTAMDPDDCTFWYVGDYVKKGGASYSTRIGAFRFPGCLETTVTAQAFYDRNHNGHRDADEPLLPGHEKRATVAYDPAYDAGPPAIPLVCTVPIGGGRKRDESATVQDGTEWITVRTLRARASADPAKYKELIKALNRGTLPVTPADPAKCKRIGDGG